MLVQTAVRNSVSSASGVGAFGPEIDPLLQASTQCNKCRVSGQGGARNVERAGHRRRKLGGGRQDSGCSGGRLRFPSARRLGLLHGGHAAMLAPEELGWTVGSHSGPRRRLKSEGEATRRNWVAHDPAYKRPAGSRDAKVAGWEVAFWRLVGMTMYYVPHCRGGGVSNEGGCC